MKNEQVNQKVYSLIRNIFSVPILNGLHAYKDEINGEVIDEGVCETKELFRDMNYNERLTHSKVSLWKKETKEIHRSNLFGQIDFRPYMIPDPYDYLMENGIDEVELLRFDYSNHSIFDLNDNKLPRAQHFDYITAKIHDGCYDLKLILEMLEKRNDIQFLKNGITPIPYYNRDSQHQNYLEFIWIPSDEDFEKVKDCLLSWDIAEGVKTFVFGFPEPKNIYE